MQGGSDALAHDRADPGLAEAGHTRWRDLRTRTLSALVAGPAFLAVLWLGGWVWTVALILVSNVLVREIGRLGRLIGLSLVQRCLLPFVYVTPALVGLIWLRHDAVVGLSNILFVLLVVWASDIAAYLIGRWAGGPLLAPWISPAKTWSGAMAGLTGAASVGLMASLYSADGRPVSAMLVAMLLGLASEAGDLIESALKRQAGVKDSGQFLPGHGGALDRLDGMLLAAPMAAVLAWAAGPGVLLWHVVPH